MGTQEWFGLVVSLLGITGAVMAGRRYWWAWYFNLAALLVWTGYSIVTRDWKYLPMLIAYFAVYGSNAWLWTRRHRKYGDARVRLTGEGRPRKTTGPSETDE